MIKKLLSVILPIVLAISNISAFGEDLCKPIDVLALAEVTYSPSSSEARKVKWWVSP